MATNRNSNDAFAVKVIGYNEYSPRRGQQSNLLGFATVSINGVAISGIRHMTGSKGEWISFPSEASQPKQRNAEPTYYPIVWLDLGSKKDNSDGYDIILKAVQDYLAEQQK